ncbi:MAG TPA: AI-2E family transporter [Cyclobacteriaceae bacterium]|nr:AI-2E family transporter [Cyclobacteriaceae bacterium]
MHNEIRTSEKLQAAVAWNGIFSLQNLYVVLAASAILYFGRTLFIPLGFAVLISFVLYPVCAWLERRRLSRTLAITASVALLSVLIIAITALLASQFLQFTKEWPSLQNRLAALIQSLGQWLTDSFGFSAEQQNQWMGKTSEQMIIGAISMLRNGLEASASSLVNAILVPVYTVLLLYHRKTWMEVLCRLFPGEERDNIRASLLMTIHTYYNFIKGMGIVYLVVGILNSVGLLLLGVPHAILFGFIASVLTFIPYVGIMVGSLLPISMAWIAYDSIWYPLGVVGVFAFIQYLEANVIFPVAVSSRLNVNTLVMLLAIFAGGILWGVSGMILFVPFVGILKLFADRHPQLETLALLLGSKK